MLTDSESIAVPKRDELMLPILIFARERLVKGTNGVFNVRWSFNFIIDELDLSKKVGDVKIKKGRSKFDNNVRFAIKYLKEAKLLKNVGWGDYVITKRGLDVLEEKPRGISTKYLMKFREFREFRMRSQKMIMFQMISIH